VTFALIAVSAYAAIGIVSAILVARSRARHIEAPPVPPPISVIIAARNEETSLPACIEALRKQQYTADFEIIVVDDDSDDSTRRVIEEASRRDQRVRYLAAHDIDAMPSGKARAIHCGVEAAQHDFIAVTDADCRPPARWLQGIAAAFQDESLGAFGGITRVDGSGLLARVQALDWRLMLSVAAGWSLAGRPLTAMGNNMAFRREAYDDVGGYPAIRESVTEDYALFQAIHGKPEWAVKLSPHALHQSDTIAVTGIAAMFRQRRRWARGALFASPLALIFYLIVLGAHALPLFILPTMPSQAAWLILVKVITDAIVLLCAGKPWKDASPVVAAATFIPYQLWLYSFVLFLPFSLAVVPDIRWKGREFRR
jgi:1,2-diacylglycerol 3-beta-glucosyltransferase